MEGDGERLTVTTGFLLIMQSVLVQVVLLEGDLTVPSTKYK